MSVGNALPDDEDELAAQLRKIGGWSWVGVGFGIERVGAQTTGVALALLCINYLSTLLSPPAALPNNNPHTPPALPMPRARAAPDGGEALLRTAPQPACSFHSPQHTAHTAGLKPAPRQVVEKREARAKKKKARKVRRLTKVTNVHLKHLLEGEASVNIETA